MVELLLFSTRCPNKFYAILSLFIQHIFRIDCVTKREV